MSAINDNRRDYMLAKSLIVYKKGMGYVIIQNE